MKFSISLIFLAVLLGVVPASYAQTTGSVTLPWSDFKTLYERGKAPPVPPEQAPLAYALSEVNLAGRQVEESVVFTGTYHLTVLRDGWVVVPVLPISVALKSATVGKEDASIFVQNGWYQLITHQSGPLDLKVEFAVSAWESAGQSGFAFQAPEVASLSLEVAVPSSDPVAFSVSGAGQSTVSQVESSQVVKAALAYTGNISVTWQRKLPAAVTSQTPRLYLEQKTLVGVGEGLLACSSALQYTILHTSVDTLLFTLPSEVVLLDVKGVGLRDWKVVEEEGKHKVTVSLNYKASGSITLYVDYELPIRDGNARVRIPELKVEGVERVKGWIGIDARSTVEVTAGEVVNVSSVDVRELPTDILGRTDHPVLLGYRYRKDGWQIPLEIRPHEFVGMLVTLVDQANATTVMTPDGRRMTQIRYAMRNNHAQFLRVSLPQGATLWSASVGGRAAKPALGDDGKILVPLLRSSATGGSLSQFEVELTYVEPGQTPAEDGKGRVETSLPLIDVPVTLYNWTYYLPRDYDVKKKSVTSNFREVDYLRTLDVPQSGVVADQVPVQQYANTMESGQAQAQGVEPVEVNLPAEGEPLLLEKLLVLSEPLTLSFDYRVDD